MDAINPALSIPAFYAHRSIFITGATGFMGKVMIEKLLRSCPDICEIFVLIRPRKELSMQDRLKYMLSLPLFDKVREEKLSSFGKLIPVNGDITTKGLGLSIDDRKMLIERVSIIIHGAANVRFNSPLRNILLCNIRSTRDICILAEEMKNLVALTYISTAYSQLDKIVIDETLYPLDIDWRHMITIAESAIHDDVLNVFTAKYIGKFVNSYTFSKRIAEQIIQHYSETLPCIIIRPSIVTPAYKEPLPGWVDVIYGPMSFHIIIAKGIIRTIYINTRKCGNYIPVDTSINMILVATWKRGITSLVEDPAPNIYNCATEVNLKPEGLILKDLLKVHAEEPCTDIIWRPAMHTTANIVWYYILNVFLHLLPALFLDGILRLRKRPPIIFELQKKVYITSIMLKHFTHIEWLFRIENVKSLARKIPLDNMASFHFNFLYEKIDLFEYYRISIRGSKKYISKEIPSMQEAAAKYYKRICLISEIIEKSFLIGIVWLLYRNGVFHWILNILLYILDRLIFGKLFTSIFFEEDYFYSLCN